MQWSKHIQPVEYLRGTRIALLPMEFNEIIAQKCGVFDEKKVLDVGCGIGSFTKYLSKAVNNTDFVGIEKDAIFCDNKEKIFNDNNFEIINGNAYDMPFEENFFDAVTSLTFFNCIEWADMALKEMIRVAKPNGIISSITSGPALVENIISRSGDYNDSNFNSKLNNLEQEFNNALKSISAGPINIDVGVKTKDIPSFFKRNKLRNVSIFPISCAFSLSDFNINSEVKKEYVENIYLGEVKRVEGSFELVGFEEFYSREKANEYEKLLKLKRDFWLNNLYDNEIWEWFGFMTVLVTGQK